MRVAICSDIHGNRHAFEAVIGAAQDEGAEELWCLGDLVGYGGDPDACVALAEANCAVCLAGNHDLAVVDVLSHRIAVMHRGRIVEQGPRDEILRNPKEAYTQRLIAAVPVPDPERQRERREQRTR